MLHTVEEHRAWFTTVMERDELWVYEDDGAKSVRHLET